MSDLRRSIPSVDALLADDRAVRWSASFGRDEVKRVLREVIADQRVRATSGRSVPDPTAILETTGARLREQAVPGLRRVLNGTGVVLHTNLGRAPLASAALEALEPVAGGYSNLEFDLATGRRGSRYAHCSDLVRRLTGSEAALVVNNNAAAVSLVVNELALDREVIVSRGELVEIGGSFRIPEIIVRSGGDLVEVGTTNRTRIEDYRRAIGPKTGLILKVHPSNYRIRGFVEDVSLAELTALSRREGVPVANDLGSGLLLSDLLPLPAEPGPKEAAAAGADVVTWSGDKLLGGPQAGIIHGSTEIVSRLRGNPLLRAFRVDKLTLAALEATMRLYTNPAAAAERIPAVAMLREPAGSVRARAEAGLAFCSSEVREALDIRPMHSVVGGGAYPEVTLESAGWCAVGRRPDSLESRCRAATPPLIGRIEDDLFCVDFRTIRPGEEKEVARVVSEAWEVP